MSTIFKTRSWLAKSMIMACGYLCGGHASEAQISNTIRAYGERYSNNLTGDFLMIGNTNMQCTSNCGTAQTNNPPVVMGYVDIDGVSSTVNSSSSNLTLPSGATVVWAGLYWSGVSGQGLYSGLVAPPSGLSKDQVKIKYGSGTNYTTVNATVRNVENTEFSGWETYMAYADITTVVQAGGSNTYYVADILAMTGGTSGSFTGSAASWSMVVVYHLPGDLNRNIEVWDGFRFFGFGISDSFRVTGIYTKPSGTFTSKIGYYALDGEASSTGDYVKVNNMVLSNNLNPANNTLNGTNSVFGVNVSTRNPNFAYNWGMDLDIFNGTGFFPNGATYVDVNLGSSSEGIWSGVFAISNELAPLVTISGHVYNDANGLKDGTVNGTGIAQASGSTLYIKLLSSDSTILETIPVNSDGTYSFQVGGQHSYFLSVSTQQQVTGQKVATPVMPSDWRATGETSNGAGTGSDGMANYNTPLISVGTTAVSNVNFGMDRIPESYNETLHFTNAPVIGVSQSLSSVPLEGSDAEDQPAQGTWSTRNLVIKTTPTNNFTLLYNGVAVQAGDTLINYDPSLLAITPGVGAAGGVMSTAFTYAVLDAAGIQDPSPATYSITWSIPLPIVLLDFTVTPLGHCKARLDWRTDEHSEYDGLFMVQHSTDAQKYSTIDEVASGAYMHTGVYTYTDQYPGGGKQYYRLAMKDEEGVISYSPVISVDLDCNTGVQVYPNPVSQTLSVSGIWAPVRVRVYDVSGKTCLKQAFIMDPLMAQINMSDLTPGIYYVVLDNNQGFMYHTRIIKK